MRNRLLAALFSIVCLAALPAGLCGQAEGGDYTEASRPVVSDSGRDSLLAPKTSIMPSGPGAFRWYHAAAILGAVALASSLDESVRDGIQDHRSAGADDASRLFRHMGQPEVYAVVALGTVTAGLVSGNDRLARAGGRITGGLLLAGTVSSALKVAVGRRRPRLGEEQYNFHPLTSANSWPSGHATVAFALATSVSDEVHSTPVTIGLYTLAGLTGWSRLNDNKHWLTDVLAGAAIGITSAKLMNGHWRVLGVGAPRLLLEPGQVGLNLQF
jgi:membrane-associated phospholipid phosphatase